jgi:hypothetical protein
MEKLKTVIAKLDEKSKGTKQRYIVGDIHSKVSGALYLSKGIKLPCEITIGFLAYGKQEVK